LFKYIAIKKNIDLRLYLNDETPQFIEADGLRFKANSVNLLSNAVKFTQKGEVVL
jgi:signal transduction histidine kinase